MATHLFNRAAPLERDVVHLERLLRAAQKERDDALTRFRAHCNELVGKRIIVDGIDMLTVTHISEWHINGRTDDGVQIGVPLILTDTVTALS